MIPVFCILMMSLFILIVLGGADVIGEMLYNLVPLALILAMFIIILIGGYYVSTIV